MTHKITLIVWMFAAILNAVASGATYPIRATHSNEINAGSAVCVGRSTTMSLFITNRHVVQNVEAVWVADGTQWRQAIDIKLGRNADVASFAVKGTDFAVSKLITGLPPGTTVNVCGYSEGRDKFCFRGRYDHGTIDAGTTHVLPGDSGGAILAQNCGVVYCVGLAKAYGTTTSRTLFVAAKDCQQHLQRVYRRPPRCNIWGGCDQPKRLYHRVDPQLFGPPKIEHFEEWGGEKQIIEPPPPPATPTDPGAIGPVGPRGPAGPPGRDATPVDLSAITRRLEAIERRERQVWITQDAADGKKQIIRRSSYKHDEPLIIDVDDISVPQ